VCRTIWIDSSTIEAEYNDINSLRDIGPDIHELVREGIYKSLYTQYGCPEIFNTDQGSQFPAEAFTGALRSRGIAVSMDGKGRWMNNVFIERLWKSVKYEDIYLKAYSSIAEAKKGLASYFTFYNETRWNQNFDRKTPAMVYLSTLLQKKAAA
jgi:putative transposase